MRYMQDFVWAMDGCLDILVDDEHPYVRAEVARQGFALDKLINDEYVGVREAVAQQGFGLDKLIKVCVGIAQTFCC